MLGALLAGYWLGSPTIRVTTREPYKAPRMSARERKEWREHEEHLKKCSHCRPSKVSEMDTIFY